MLKIIESRLSGKTTMLLELAKPNTIIIVSNSWKRELLRVYAQSLCEENKIDFVPKIYCPYDFKYGLNMSSVDIFIDDYNSFNKEDLEEINYFIASFKDVSLKISTM